MSEGMQAVLPATAAGPVSVAVIMTGGTIAKTYDPQSGELVNIRPIVDDIIDGLRTDDLQVDYIEVMNVDSRKIDEPGRKAITEAVGAACRDYSAVLVVHGTDSLVETARALCGNIKAPGVPVVLTGAMIPHALRSSDAVQNVTEALIALRILPAGFYLVFHNQVFRLPDVKKDYEAMTFRAG